MASGRLCRREANGGLQLQPRGFRGSPQTGSRSGVSRKAHWAPGRYGAADDAGQPCICQGSLTTSAWYMASSVTRAKLRLTKVLAWLRQLPWPKDQCWLTLVLKDPFWIWTQLWSWVCLKRMLLRPSWEWQAQLYPSNLPACSTFPSGTLQWRRPLFRYRCGTKKAKACWPLSAWMCSASWSLRWMAPTGVLRYRPRRPIMRQCLRNGV